jgi:hypothetical protein
VNRAERAWPVSRVLAQMKRIIRELGAECVDGLKMREKHSARILKGWEMKPYAILHSPFREVLFLDADNVPVENPEFLFETAQFKEFGPFFGRTSGACSRVRLYGRSAGYRTGGAEMGRSLRWEKGYFFFIFFACVFKGGGG